MPPQEDAKIAIGNLWLGSLVNNTIVSSNDMTVSSMVITTTAFSVPQALYGVGVTISGACTEQMYVTLTPAAGVNYSVVAYNTSTSGQANIFWRPDPPMFIFPGDSVTVKVLNTGTTGGCYAFITTMY